MGAYFSRQTDDFNAVTASWLCIWGCVLSAAFFCGCSESPSNNESNHELTLPTDQNIMRLDPRGVGHGPAGQIVNMLFEGLMRFDKDGNIVPGLAESFVIENDCTEYTFFLRDAQWSNGDKVTAHDFEYTWKSSLDPPYLSSSEETLLFIKNAREYLQGQCQLEDVGVRALDDATLKVTLSKPFADFLELLAHPHFKAVSMQRDMQSPGWNAHAKEMFTSNGPFVLDRWKKGALIRLKKNPSYWNASAVHLHAITVEYIPEMRSQMHLFQKGKLDWVGEPFSLFDFEGYSNLPETGSVSVVNGLGVKYVFMNTEKWYLGNKNVRTALALALDKQAVADHLLSGLVQPSYRFLPDEFFVSPPSNLFLQDQKRAKKCFERGLWELGIEKRQFPTLRLVFANLGANRKIAEVIQSQLLSVLGIRSELQTYDWKMVLNRMRMRDYDLGLCLFRATHRDPITFFSLFFKKNERSNISGWENFLYQTQYERALKEKNSVKRARMYTGLEAMLLKEVPVIPLYFFVHAYFVSNRLQDYFFSDLALVDLTYASLRNDEPKAKKSGVKNRRLSLE